MSLGETEYSFRVPYPDYLVRGRAQTLRLECYRSGVLVAPTTTGSTFSLFEPGEDLDTGTPLLGPTAITLSTDGAATYALAATALDDEDFGRGWVEDWNLVLADATTRHILRPACIVRRPLYPVITDLDVDPDGSLAQHRKPSLSTWQAYIDAAWADLLGQLEQDNRWPELMWSPHSFRALHKRMTLVEIYRTFARSGGGKWMDLLSEEEKQVAFAWRALRAVLDTDQDGHPETLAAQGLAHGTVLGSYTPSTRYGFGGLS